MGGRYVNAWFSFFLFFSAQSNLNINLRHYISPNIGYYFFQLNFFSYSCAVIINQTREEKIVQARKQKPNCLFLLFQFRGRWLKVSAWNWDSSWSMLLKFHNFFSLWRRHFRFQIFFDGRLVIIIYWMRFAFDFKTSIVLSQAKDFWMVHIWDKSSQ